MTILGDELAGRCRAVPTIRVRDFPTACSGATGAAGCRCLLNSGAVSEAVTSELLAYFSDPDVAGLRLFQTQARLIASAVIDRLLDGPFRQSSTEETGGS
jgi:hypothetical protein